MAATPLLPQALEAMREVALLGGNPSSPHGVGRAARRHLEQAGDALRALMQAPRAEVLWTGGGPEAQALPLLGLAQARRAAAGCQTVCVPWASQPSTQACLTQLRAAGWQVERDLAALRADTAVLMLEVVSAAGSVSSLRDTCDAARAVGVPVHAVLHGGVGEFSCDFNALGLDACTLWGHKLGGPAGVGAILLRKGLNLPPLWYGGGQQRGMRPGTEPTPLIVGMGYAAGTVSERINPQWASWSAELEAHAQAIPGAWALPRASTQLPSVARVGVSGLSGAALVEGYSQHGVMVAAVASREQGAGAVRLSLGWNSNADDVDGAKAALTAVVRNIRE